MVNFVLGFQILLGGFYANVNAQLVDQAVVPPVLDELKCVSGFCLPRGYKKLETPDEGLYFSPKIKLVLKLIEKRFSVPYFPEIRPRLFLF